MAADHYSFCGGLAGIPGLLARSIFPHLAIPCCSPHYAFFFTLERVVSPSRCFMKMCEVVRNQFRLYFERCLRQTKPSGRTTFLFHLAKHSFVVDFVLRGKESPERVFVVAAVNAIRFRTRSRTKVGSCGWGGVVVLSSAFGILFLTRGVGREALSMSMPMGKDLCHSNPDADFRLFHHVRARFGHIFREIFHLCRTIALHRRKITDAKHVQQDGSSMRSSSFLHPHSSLLPCLLPTNILYQVITANSEDRSRCSVLVSFIAKLTQSPLHTIQLLTIRFPSRLLNSLWRTTKSAGRLEKERPRIRAASHPQIYQRQW